MARAAVGMEKNMRREEEEYGDPSSAGGWRAMTLQLELLKRLKLNFIPCGYSASAEVCESDTWVTHLAHNLRECLRHSPAPSAIAVATQCRLQQLLLFHQRCASARRGSRTAPQREAIISPSFSTPCRRAAVVLFAEMLASLRLSFAASGDREEVQSLAMKLNLRGRRRNVNAPAFGRW